MQVTVKQIQKRSDATSVTKVQPQHGLALKLLLQKNLGQTAKKVCNRYGLMYSVDVGCLFDCVAVVVPGGHISRNFVAQVARAGITRAADPGAVISRFLRLLSPPSGMLYI